MNQPMKLTPEDRKALQGAMNMLVEILQQSPPEVPERVEEWPEDEHLRGEFWKDRDGDHLHYIEHRHEAGCGIKTTFTCKGDRNSPCHQYPPADSCTETWGESDRETFVAHDDCWIESWMEGDDCAVLCGPDSEPVRSGPIHVTWGGDCVEWEYAEPAVTPGDVHQARADADRARSDAGW